MEVINSGVSPLMNEMGSGAGSCSCYVGKVDICTYFKADCFIHW